jgi:hypothetical protein
MPDLRPDLEVGLDVLAECRAVRQSELILEGPRMRNL